MTVIGFALYIAIALFAGYKTWRSLQSAEFDASTSRMVKRDAEMFGAATIIIAMIYFAPLIFFHPLPFFGPVLLAAYAFITWVFLLEQRVPADMVAG